MGYRRFGITGFYPRRWAFIGAAFLAGALGMAWSQAPGDLRCDLHLRATPGAGGSADCLDLEALTSGAVLSTGSNVTRISADGLRFCKDAFKVTTGGSADIVFLVDNSGSMWSQRAFVGGGGGDTVFINDGPCGVGTGGTMSYGVLDDKANPPATRRTVATLQSDPGTGCEFAGDPYNSRAYVVRKAVDFLADKSPQSTAGVLGFAAATMHEQSPLQLNTPANVARVKGRMVPDSAFGTNYGIALDTALKWLADSTLIRNTKQAIVLISDGRPGWGFDLARDTTNVPVYGIFLGRKSTPDTATLKGLSDKTGGLFFRVDPTKGNALQAVMDSILKKITATAVPKALSMTNTSLSPAQTSLAKSMTLDAQENLAVSLDSILALSKGGNALRFQVTLADGSVKTYDLNVQADGAAASASTPRHSCYPMPSLSMLNAQGRVDPEYPGLSAPYTIRLTRSPTGDGTAAIQSASFDSARTAGWGDAEAISIATAGTAGTLSAFQGPYPFNGLGVQPIRGNGILEAPPGGWVELSWRHPRDPREAAVFTLKGSRIKVTAPPTANPPSRSFSSLEPPFPVTLLPGEPGSSIHYTLDGSPVTTASPVFSAPFTVSATTTVKAMAVKADQAPSPVVEFIYTRVQAPKVATPGANPPGPGSSSYAFTVMPQPVSFTVATPGATIWYSFEGSDFHAGTGFSIPSGGTLRLFATLDGMYPSDTATFRFEYNGPTRVYVQFPNGKSEPVRGEPAGPRVGQDFLFIPIDKNGAALEGNAGGKCGPVCVSGGGSPGALFAGPVINLELPGPCRYEFAIFSSHGEFVAEGRGEFTAADLAALAPSADGSGRVARVVWTGRASNGRLAGSGAYILRTTLQPMGILDPGLALDTRSTLTRFGLLRNP